ncbi:hypothetical protein PsYK624_148610 [Phanerochaete sordida]|uniref:Uncharacterized protein n=1 Tax=Phanerochaete sordida TaxID=48140 RepID=A0A9P3GNB1_9APHY|nr:hypothetical protein PsYK624_148610 [Phanerochaete sordida]
MGSSLRGDFGETYHLRQTWSFLERSKPPKRHFLSCVGRAVITRYEAILFLEHSLLFSTSLASLASSDARLDTEPLVPPLDDTISVSASPLRLDCVQWRPIPLRIMPSLCILQLSWGAWRHLGRHIFLTVLHSPRIVIASEDVSL